MSPFGNTALILVLLLETVFLSSHISSVECQCKTVSNIGREFYIGHPFLLSQRDFHYIIYIASQSTNGTVFVQAPAFGVNQSYSIQHGVCEINLPHAIHNFLSNPSKAVYLKSNVDISVSVLSYGNPIRFMDAFLALSIEALSRDYIVAGAKYLDDYPSDLLVVGTEQGTNVSQVSSKFGNSEFTLGRLDAFYNDTDADLSGVRVHSDKPVAVFAGVAAAVVPSDGRTRYGSEMLLGSILPNTFGGHNFIVPHLPTRNNFVVKVFAIESGTVVHFHNSTANLNINVTDYFEMTLGNESVVISADKPVMVYQYGFSSANEPYGEHMGTFMRSVPAIKSYVSHANFVVQSKVTEINNYVQIITNTPSVVYIDDKPLTSLNHSWYDRQEYVTNNKTYSVMSMELDKLKALTNSCHVIRSNGNAVFGALIAGYGTRYQQAYGYPIGIQTEVCEGPASAGPTEQQTHTSTSHQSTQPATSTTTLPSLSTSTGQHESPVTTSTPATMVPVTPTNTSAQGPLCLQCDDLTHLYLCEAFVRCSTTQLCIVERYQNSAGQRRFRAGCKDTQLCTSKSEEPNSDRVGLDKRQSETSACSECCHGNFCNSDGCGAERFPYPRGPACLTCLHTLSVDECNTVTYCQPDEVCSIQVSEWFGAMPKMQLQCASKQCLPGKRAAVDRRSTVLCHNCCSSDYCNFECQRHSPAPDIIG